MNTTRFTKSAAVAVAVLVFATTSAFAASITYNTNSALTGFVSSNGSPITVTNLLASSNNPQSSLLFTPNPTAATGTPSGLNLGDFLLTCTGCGTTASTIFNPFSFDLVVTDVTDGATGMFIGTSSGGTVSSNSTTIVIHWATAIVGSLELGPGTFNANSGNFGTTVFNKLTADTVLAAPNSGSPVGVTTIQGQIADSSVPEPATYNLLAGSLLCLAFFGRRKLARS